MTSETDNQDANLALQAETKLNLNNNNNYNINNNNDDEVESAKSRLSKLLAVHTNSNSDEPDLEYDDDIGSLVTAEQEDQKIGSSQFTHESLIDEDFEAELGNNPMGNKLEAMNNSDSQVADPRLHALKERIDRYGIVKVCSSDLQGRLVIVISACKLPISAEVEKEKEIFKSHQNFFEVLYEVLSTTLEKYVESEYTIVYFHHGLQKASQPSFSWLVRVYKMLDRKFKKNLKAFYIVHPTYLVKFLFKIFRPLISSKFHKKVTYCNSLNDLSNHLDLKHLSIPDEVMSYDVKLSEKKKLDVSSQSTVDTQQNTYGKFQQFKVPLEYIASQNNGDCVPLVIKETIIFLRQHLNEEGLFRKSGPYERIKEIQRLYNQGEPVAYDQNEVHVATCVLKAFFRELPESLLPDSIFNEMMSLQALDTTDKVEVARDLLKAKLPKENYILLKELILFLNEVVQHSDENKMDAKNLSYVFGPNFLRTKNGVQIGLIDIERINSFVELLIRFHTEIFSTID